jgi:hypothetical protein
MKIESIKHLEFDKMSFVVSSSDGRKSAGTIIGLAVNWSKDFHEKFTACERLDALATVIEVFNLY